MNRTELYSSTALFRRSRPAPGHPHGGHLGRRHGCKSWRHQVAAARTGRYATTHRCVCAAGARGAAIGRSAAHPGQSLPPHTPACPCRTPRPVRGAHPLQSLPPRPGRVGTTGESRQSDGDCVARQTLRGNRLGAAGIRRHLSDCSVPRLFFTRRRNIWSQPSAGIFRRTYIFRH